MIILTPTNARITARPCCRYSNLECMSANMKYSDRRPMMANAFEVNTMNCSLLTAKHCGHRVDGEQHVGRLHEQQHCEQRCGITLAVDAHEHLLAVQLRSRRHEPPDDRQEPALDGSTASLSANNNLPAVYSKNAPNTNSIHSNRVISGDAGEDEHTPQHEGAEHAPEQHRAADTRAARGSNSG
jgi:hypothetical protein